MALPLWLSRVCSSISLLAPVWIPQNPGTGRYLALLPHPGRVTAQILKKSFRPSPPVPCPIILPRYQYLVRSPKKRPSKMKGQVPVRLGEGLWNEIDQISFSCVILRNCLTSLTAVVHVCGLQGTPTLLCTPSFAIICGSQKPARVQSLSPTPFHITKEVSQPGLTLVLGPCPLWLF